MSLKLIPVEPSHNEQHGKKQKQFNPGNKIKKNDPQSGANGFLKNICFSLVHFINRGSKFTYQQIDDLIMVLHRSILNLQKRKQELMSKKANSSKKRSS